MASSPSRKFVMICWPHSVGAGVRCQLDKSSRLEVRLLTILYQLYVMH